METTSKTEETKQEEEESTREDPSPSPFSKQEDLYKIKIDEMKEIQMNGKEKKNKG